MIKPENAVLQTGFGTRICGVKNDGRCRQGLDWNELEDRSTRARQIEMDRVTLAPDPSAGFRNQRSLARIELLQQKLASCRQADSRIEPDISADHFIVGIE